MQLQYIKNTSPPVSLLQLISWLSPTYYYYY